MATGELYGRRARERPPFSAPLLTPTITPPHPHRLYFPKDSLRYRLSSPKELPPTPPLFLKLSTFLRPPPSHNSLLRRLYLTRNALPCCLYFPENSLPCCLYFPEKSLPCRLYFPENSHPRRLLFPIELPPSSPLFLKRFPKKYKNYAVLT